MSERAHTLRQVLGICLLVIAAPGAFADAPPAPREPCPVETPEQAHSLADALLARGAYQRAGVCYEAAGDYPSANRAFFAALAPESAASARRAAEDQGKAQALLTQVKRAFRADH